MQKSNNASSAYNTTTGAQNSTHETQNATSGEQCTLSEAQTASSKKRLPISLDNFEQLRHENLYYVDKTGLVEEMLDNWPGVTLFTRPRRFGKSLNMSMLQCFFEVGSDPALFDGLRIMQRPDLCERYMGKFPVISLTLKDVARNSFDKSFFRLKEIVLDEILRHEYLFDSKKLTDRDKATYEALASGDFTNKDFPYSITKLCALLEKHHGQKTVILIDEYDVPLDKAYIYKYYDKMVDLIRAMFSSALKSNKSLQFAVLTGCLRVSKESIFTGLNNFRVCGTSDNKYTEFFGFTEGEVREMLEYYGRKNRLKDAKAWYDGYHFGDQEIYCPWDVINFCADIKNNANAEPKNYWVNTSSNDIVRDLINRCDTEVAKVEIENLISGGTITKKISENITHREIKNNNNNLWSLLYMTGYLTLAETPRNGTYTLRIPNYEITQIYKDQIIDWFENKLSVDVKDKSEKYQKFFDAFEQGDAPVVEKFLSEYLLDTISFNDSDEGFYHGTLLTLLTLCSRWYARSNTEEGYGRGDIRVDKPDYSFGAIVEVKSLKADEYKKLDDTCNAAMDQIERNKYTNRQILEGYSPIYKYAITFCVKRCRVVCKREEL